MSILRILICGGGCAGPALAFWLARAGHQVVLVERFPALRASGAQVDLRAQGIEVIKRMGLLNAVNSKLVDEAGVSFVNSQGEVKATIMANTSGKGTQSLTSEFEIMRGDFVRILYNATKDNVKYVFGKTVELFEENEKEIVVHFSDKTSDTFDLLVGADGQGSRIRKVILPARSPEPYQRLGIYMAYFFIPRTESDNNIRRTYHAPGGRMIMRRTHNQTETQVYFILKDDSLDASLIPGKDIEQQKKFWAKRFHNAGWQTDRFLEAMKTTQSFYCQEALQVRSETWHKGRVVLLGDAAYCPSPFSGMGTTGSLVGAYVLAGEINRSSDDLPGAFKKYDKTVRPFIEEIQKINPFLLRLGIPDTAWGIAILHFVAGLLCYLRIPYLIARFSETEKGGWKLPDYDEPKQV
ncbi:hypothetical protein BGW36DRAFT_306503 [Talaromyces proteolyticus]|uniref:FAD-binding domain-containing protein n=1 Tax=Talaromyces proteolyticus TaxID=1131652 RepID=A0AAD4KG67_9EURO|nr:uncharacterized protein BGW36DRAFT_306503 [Talaromyces proteolyticus]KAH8690440.1 hypothetical protein BGW36DRAFT_306503 [Talaromyces proteolyticus]